MGKHKPGDVITVRGLSTCFSFPSYTGSGSNRVGSTIVTLEFELSDGSTLIKTELFDNIRVTTSELIVYTIGIYDITVRVTVTVVGQNNQMNITDVTADITSKTVIG